MTFPRHPFFPTHLSRLYQALLAFALLTMTASLASAAGFVIENSGFESPISDGWSIISAGGADTQAYRDTAVFHGGSASCRIEARSALAAGVWSVLISNAGLPTTVGQTYRLTFWAKGQGAGSCYGAVQFQGSGGDRRYYLPTGDSDWAQYTLTFDVPSGATSTKIMFGLDGPTTALWIDDITMEEADPRSNLTANWEPRPYATAYPRASQPPAEHLAVLNVASWDRDTRMMMAVMQGIINRTQPRIYLINGANDQLWLDWLVAQGHTGTPNPVASPSAMLSRFSSEINGAIVFDPALPGTIHAACMLGALRNALPCTANKASQYGLTVLEDLRGRFTRNVDAYRYVYENHWAEMNHHALAVHYPLMDYQGVRDYLAQNNIFTFWVSNENETTAGKDPSAEMDFAHELLAATPPNIPVLGWWSQGVEGNGISEYEGMTLSSSYGKYLAGSEFNSNTSVHSGVVVIPSVFNQDRLDARPRIVPQADKIYLAMTVYDSGDAHWYWQSAQRTAWDDPRRGSVPIGWSLTPGVLDTMPGILEWYYRNATANDEFVCAVSGVGYMNTAHFAERFREADRERAWNEYLATTSDYCAKLDLDMIEMYTGGWGDNSPPNPEVFPRYFAGVDGLKGLMPDFGRSANITGDNAFELTGGHPVFHTINRWNTDNNAMATDVEFTIDEILGHSPSARPGLLSGMLLSWTMLPTQAEQVFQGLPTTYQGVLPSELPEIWQTLQNAESRNWTIFR